MERNVMIAMNISARVIPFALRMLTFAAASVAVAGCGRVPGQLVFLHNQAPDEGCSISADEGHPYIGTSVVDVSLVRASAESGLWVFPLLKNNLPGSGDGLDPNQIFISSFAVDISMMTGPPSLQTLFATLESDATTRALLHYKTPWSGTIKSGGGTLATSVASMPTDLAARLAAETDVAETPDLWLNVKIRAFGSSTTQTFESDPFDYPVSVCSGCLVGNIRPCPYTSPPANTGNPCNVAQDGIVDCCLAGNDLICPPPVVL
jgi:hypothetical protein